MNDERDEFSVYVFDRDERSHRVAGFVDVRRAVRIARTVTLVSDATAPFEVERVIITDGGDFTVFEWKRAHGVTFPPEARWQR
jgi:hypothetical protein